MTGATALDSNAVRAVRAFEPSALRALGDATPVLPCVVLAEALTGWHLLMERYGRKQDETGLAQALNQLCEFQEFTRDLELLRYSPDALITFATLRQGRGNRSRDDLRIAAICIIAHDVPLLTRNVRDFDDLPGLKLKTW